jgi:hypothetical protein
MRPSVKYRHTPPGIATMLNRWFVALTAGLVKPSTLTWKGKSRKAPDTPPIEVKREIVNATAGGIQGLISMSAIGKYIDLFFLAD